MADAGEFSLKQTGMSHSKNDKEEITVLNCTGNVGERMT